MEYGESQVKTELDVGNINKICFGWSNVGNPIRERTIKWWFQRATTILFLFNSDMIRYGCPRLRTTCNEKKYGFSLQRKQNPHDQLHNDFFKNCY